MKTTTLLLSFALVISFSSYSQTLEETANYRLTPSTLNTSITPVKLNNPSRLFSIPIRSLLYQPPTLDKVYIDFVGSGDIQKSVSEGKDINANTGLGIIFERFSGKKDNNQLVIDKVIQSLELEATINIATTADTIEAKFENNEFQNRRSFGTYVLNPVSARQSLYINSNIYFGYPQKDGEDSPFAKFASVVSGVNIRAISSNNVWKYRDTITNLGVMAFRGGVFHEFIPDNYRLTKDEFRSKHSIFLGANYTYRGVFGDMTSSKNDTLRMNILGSSQKQFHGLEINFGFRLNNLRAEFQMPILVNKDGAIDGLTNTQFLFSIKFIGGFSLKIKDEEENQQSATPPSGE